MKTNLAYINDVFHEKTEAEIQAPVLAQSQLEIVAKESRRVIAGFHITDNSRRETAYREQIEKRRTLLDIYRVNRDQLRKSLEERGVTPRAILPTTAWERICIANEIYRLEPDVHGKVWVDRRAVEPNGRFDKWMKQLDALSHEEFLQKMLPNYQEADGLVMLATLVMPTPPKSVVETLLKCDGLYLSVAAVAEAVNFLETRYELAMHARALRDAEEKARQRRLADPIIATELGNATAIVDQFGEFPVERETVDRIVDSEQLLVGAPINPKTHGVKGITALGGRFVQTNAMADEIRQAEIAARYREKTMESIKNSQQYSLRNRYTGPIWMP
jgi:hypothetical protein